ADWCELLRGRWVANHRCRCVARLQRHARTALVCSGELLVGRLCVGLRAGVSSGLRRGRRLVRVGARARLLRGVTAVALLPAHPPRIFAEARGTASRSSTAVIEQLFIARLGRRGDGVVDSQAGPIYVPYTLPGEAVEVEPWPGHPDRRQLLRVETAS